MSHPIKKYRAILFAPDGDWVTDYEADSIEEVWDKVDNGGSRWFFYPIRAVIRSHGHMAYSTQRIIDAPPLFEHLSGRTITTFVRYLIANQGFVFALLSE